MLKILLLGRYGQLGWELERTLATIGEVTALDYPEIDLTQLHDLVEIVHTASPDVIINATAYTAVDQAEKDHGTAMAINADAPRKLAELAKELNSALIHYSTDYVFDGEKDVPYIESDQPNPLNMYGRSKLEGEQAVQAVGGAYLVLRTSWVYSVRRSSFVTKVLEWSRSQPVLRVVDDQVSGPTWCRSLAEATAQLIARSTQPYSWILERAGIYHLAGDGHASRFTWAKTILDLDPEKHAQVTKDVLPVPTSEFPTPAKRPLFTPLNCDLFASTFGLRLPAWQLALQLAME